MMRIRIFRSYGEKATLGKGWVELPGSYPLFDFVTLELPWKDNTPRISCIPEGEYTWIKHESPKFGLTLWLQGVPNRSEILIHPGNYTSEILGCILPGDSHKDINSDNIPDVTNSRAMMAQILDKVGLTGTIVFDSI